MQNREGVTRQDMSHLCKHRLPRVVYRQAYALLENVTPLKKDCGELCGKACCHGLEDHAGMYLFPGEEAMFDGEIRWATIERHLVSEREFCPAWDGQIEEVYFLVCNGACPRQKRPLACRLFPLAADPVPVLLEPATLNTTGHTHSERPVQCLYEIDVVLDADAALLCPLARYASLDDLDPEFIKACKEVYRLLAQDPLILADLCWQAERRREDARAPWRKLLS